MCSLRASTLPNGLRVHHVSQQDLKFIYGEVYVQRSYLQHGVALHLGDTVLDIGAPSVCNQAHVCWSRSATNVGAALQSSARM